MADPELAEGHRLGIAAVALGGGRQAAQEGLDAGKQDAGLDRLGDVVVGAHLKTENLVEVLVACGQHQDHAAIMRSHGATDLEAVLAGQHDVEDDQVGLFGQNTGLRGVAPRLDIDLQIVLGEIFGGQFGQPFVVFDKEDACVHPAILAARSVESIPA